MKVAALIAAESAPLAGLASRWWGTVSDLRLFPPVQRSIRSRRQLRLYGVVRELAGPEAVDARQTGRVSCGRQFQVVFQADSVGRCRYGLDEQAEVFLEGSPYQAICSLGSCPSLTVGRCLGNQRPSRDVIEVCNEAPLPPLTKLGGSSCPRNAIDFDSENRVEWRHEAFNFFPGASWVDPL